MTARAKQPGLTLVGGRGGRRGPRSPNALWDVRAPVMRADDVGSICAGCGEPLPDWINTDDRQGLPL